MTNFAARLVTKMTRYMRRKSDFVIEDWGYNLFNIRNKAYEATYQVILDTETGCNCTFTSLFAIACWQIFAVRFLLTDSMEDKSSINQKESQKIAQTIS